MIKASCEVCKGTFKIRETGKGGKWMVGLDGSTGGMLDIRFQPNDGVLQGFMIVVNYCPFCGRKMREN